MKVPDSSATRTDRAVIMARGLGARMGVPKGLLRLTDQGPTFLRIIADLYETAGLPVDVVVRPQDAEAYGAVLKDAPNARMVPTDGGGDTALTLLAAWRFWRGASIECSHVWAHPVDLPLVTADTLTLLKDRSRQGPDRILRPTHLGVPGHPVILPTKVLELLEVPEQSAAWSEPPLRDFLSAATARGWISAPVPVPVEDQGVVLDFDRPEDMTTIRQDKRGAP